MTYEILKTLHVLFVCLMVGATAINGLLHALAVKDDNLAGRATTVCNILQVNRWIMAPGFAGIIISGVWMVISLGFSTADFWLATSIILTALLLAGFFFGHHFERRLATLARIDAERGKSGDQYRSVFKKAAPIGAAAAVLSVIVIYLMVAKPTGT